MSGEEVLSGNTYPNVNTDIVTIQTETEEPSNINDNMDSDETVFSEYIIVTNTNGNVSNDTDLELLDKAAVKIQSTFRGFRVRKDLGLRDEGSLNFPK